MLQPRPNSKLFSFTSNLTSNLTLATRSSGFGAHVENMSKDRDVNPGKSGNDEAEYTIYYVAFYHENRKSKGYGRRRIIYSYFTHFFPVRLPYNNKKTDLLT